MSISIKVQNYRVGRTLGQGAYGKVKIAENETIEEPVAFKILNKNKIRKLGLQEKVKREVKTMKKLWHPHIVCLYQVINTNSDIFLAMELAKGGDMYDRICTNGKLSESESKRLFRQMAAALVFCHSKGIAHRDLKLENLLFDSNQNLKIADFGLCNTMKDGESLQTACGSPDYAAPEILMHEAYDGTKIDAWSSGVILYTMLYGELPFDGKNQSQMFQKVIAGDFTFKESVADVSKDAKDLIRKLLDPNPSTRYSMKQAQAHPWLSDTDSNSYFVDYSKFLAQNEISLKPKELDQLDDNVLDEISRIKTRFPVNDELGLNFGQILAKFFKSSHKSSSLQKKLGRNSAAVQNLCVAYKFLMHRRLVEVSMQREIQRQENIRLGTQQDNTNKFSKASDLITCHQLTRLAKLRSKVLLPPQARQIDSQNQYKNASNKFKLFLSVETVNPESLDKSKPGVGAILSLVCKALLDLSYTWQFTRRGSNQTEIEGKMMSVSASDEQESFQIHFYHSAPFENSSVTCLQNQYALDFCPDTKSNEYRIGCFDAILEAYNAILKRVRQQGEGDPESEYMVQIVDTVSQNSQADCKQIWQPPQQKQSQQQTVTETEESKKLNENYPNDNLEQINNSIPTYDVMTKEHSRSLSMKSNSTGNIVNSSYYTVETQDTFNDKPFTFQFDSSNLAAV